MYINGNKQQATSQTHGEARATQETGQQPSLPARLCLRSSFLYLMAREASPAEFCRTAGADLRKQKPTATKNLCHLLIEPTVSFPELRKERPGLSQEDGWGPPTTSVLVILARRSTRASPVSELTSSSCWSPQMAAPTLPVAIIDGGYMANLKSARTRGGRSGPPRTHPLLSLSFTRRPSFAHDRGGSRFKRRRLSRTGRSETSTDKIAHVLHK